MTKPHVPGIDQKQQRKDILLYIADRQREIYKRKMRTVRQRSMALFVKHVAPWFVIEEIHLLMYGYIEALFDLVIDRLMIFMSPRAGKSQTASVFAPSNYLGRYPERKMVQVSYAFELARDFGREVRDLVNSEEYGDIFPNVSLSDDSKSAGRWHTNKRGMYFAAGTEKGIAGRGFHLGGIDDPLSEQDAYSETAKKRVQRWYPGGFYSRQQPEASAILLMTTRWAKDDLAGWLLKQRTDNELADLWTTLSVPAIIDEATAEMLNEVAGDPLLLTKDHPKPYKFKEGDSFAPRRWPKDLLLRRKANTPENEWLALYQQKPVEEEGNILKRRYWKRWPHSEPPECVYVIQVWDTAFEEDEAADFSARTTWGIFEIEDRVNADGVKLPPFGCILLERYNQRVGFPQLREEAETAYKLFKPDRVLIEKKASGISLIQELRRKIPIKALRVDKSKRARASAASIVLEQGCVYYMDRNWAQQVIDQCSDFKGIGKEVDDLVDTCVYAWLYLRRMFHLRLPDEMDDEKNDEIDLMKRRLYG